MIIHAQDRRRLIDAAMGRIDNDLILFNTLIVNVYTGEVLNGEIWVLDGFISHVEIHDGKQQLGKSKQSVDACGAYVIPGFIDPHVHIESSMLTPRQFAAAVLPHGTTTVVTDSHEIANVFGLEGVYYMHDSALEIPLRQLIHVPSCVPSVLGLENNGATFEPAEIESLFKLKNVVGLAEVMDFIGVINNEDRIHELLDIALKQGRFIQGHAPSLMGHELSAYRCGGQTSDHEVTTAQEALESLRLGIYVDARDSSISQDIPSIVQGIKNVRYLDRLTLCTDDREAQDLLNEGSIDGIVNKIIAEGLDPIDAIRAATLNAATQIKEEALGVIAPACVADFFLSDRIDKIKALKVFVGGKLVAEDGRLIQPLEETTYPLEQINSINIPSLTLEDLQLKAPILNGDIEVNVLTFVDTKSLVTRIQKETLKVKDGLLSLSDPQLKIVAVLNRYGLPHIAVHVVRNFGTVKGCVASTVSHDSHNLIMVYDDPKDAYIAVKQLQKTRGGMCCVLNSEVTAALALPVAGLMANVSVVEMAKNAESFKQALRDFGLTAQANPLLRIVTLALPVIPFAKMSDLGCVDVVQKKFIPLFEPSSRS